jgi:hypothetical protein
LRKRQDLALVMARDVVSRAIDTVSIARLGADVDGALGQAVEGEIVGLGRLPDTAPRRRRRSDLELQRPKPRLAERRALRVLRAAGDAGEDRAGRDEARRLGDVSDLASAVSSRRAI